MVAQATARYTTAADVLRDLCESLDADGVTLVLAELKDPVRRLLDRYGLTEVIGPARFYPTLEAAVAAYPGEPAIERGQGAADAAD